MTTSMRKIWNVALPTAVVFGAVACGGGKIGSSRGDATTPVMVDNGDVGTEWDLKRDGGAGSAADTAVVEGPPPESVDVPGDPGSTVLPTTPGTVDQTPPTNTNLPALPRFTNVKATAAGDSVTISFDPVDQAVDYRVYELPAPEAVSATSDGHVTIQNAIYRCAGSRQAPFTTLDGAPQVQSGAIKTLVDNQNVEGYRRSLADATLGYVYLEPGEGRVPVYALGEHRRDADNECFFQRWTASRAKQYVTTDAARDALLNQGFRDDGIAFYVPAAASASTKQIYTSTSDSARFYFATAAEKAVRSNATNAFLALTAAAAGTAPLMRVFYENGCGFSHDELVAGKARFDFVRKQGDKQPLTKLRWSGLTGQKTLVIEALDAGCPFKGLIGPKAHPARGDYQAWITLDQAKAASASHEVFINGQFDGTNPKPIARSYITVSPAAAPALDWSYGFTAASTLGTFSSVACPSSDTAPDACSVDEVRFKSDSAYQSFENLDGTRSGQALNLGENWIMYSDFGSDTNGRYRLTPNTKADITADTYLYVVMEVDSFSTGRRYPQLLISDRDAPIQPKLPQGRTLVLQTFGDWPNVYELQVCDHKNWDVNDQCPRFDFYYQRDPRDVNNITGLAPNVEVGDQVGMDHSNRFEIYVSSKRAYVYFDGKPFGCAILPAAGVPTGAVTVTYGDVLYHSGVDYLFDYTMRRRQIDAFRHLDNLGFKSHVSAPAWNEKRFPCTAHLLEPH